MAAKTKTNTKIKRLMVRFLLFGVALKGLQVWPMGGERSMPAAPGALSHNALYFTKHYFTKTQPVGTFPAIKARKLPLVPQATGL
jgi:hypothetical protein